MQAPDAAIARVDDISTALRVSEQSFSSQTLGRVSPQLCCAVFRLRSAASVCVSFAVNLVLLRVRIDALSALRYIGL